MLFLKQNYYQISILEDSWIWSQWTEILLQNQAHPKTSCMTETFQPALFLLWKEIQLCCLSLKSAVTKSVASSKLDIRFFGFFIKYLVIFFFLSILSLECLHSDNLFSLVPEGQMLISDLMKVVALWSLCFKFVAFSCGQWCLVYCPWWYAPNKHPGIQLSTVFFFPNSCIISDFTENMWPQTEFRLLH